MRRVYMINGLGFIKCSALDHLYADLLSKSPLTKFFKRFLKSVGLRNYDLKKKKKEVDKKSMNFKENSEREIKRKAEESDSHTRERQPAPPSSVWTPTSGDLK